MIAVPRILSLLMGLAFSLSFSSCVPPASNQPSVNNAATPNVSSNVASNTASNIAVSSPPTYVRNFSENPDFDAEAWLGERVKDKSMHAVLIASLEPGRTIARYNVDKGFNPASVVKLATTLVALKKLGADHRFKISVFTDGKINKKGTLEGDVYFAGGAPTFDDNSAELIEQELKKRGIKGISGKLFVSKDFSFNFTDSAERSAALFADRMKLNPKPQTAVAEKPMGTELFVFESHPLRQVLRYQNTFSNNFVAQKLGESVGGVEVIRQFLVNELGLPSAEVKLETASGLGENSMTARGIFIILQELDAELKRQNLKPIDILPSAAEKNSTLGEVLNGSKFERAVAGKTGTLSAADGGIGMASLAGFIYTKNDGVFIYVLMDQGDEVKHHKELQNQLLGTVLGNVVELENLENDGSVDLLPKSDLSIKDGPNLPEKR
ncbi:MAG TPA: D-alanyl-D-alanine carboxypeptidase [Pyrinomonadaceae bacterium]|nr:D-alanyl-D-alanine carboxypeptidase [Pyrinomonadaceae bacterium]